MHRGEGMAGASSACSVWVSTEAGHGCVWWGWDRRGVGTGGVGGGVVRCDGIRRFGVRCDGAQWGLGEVVFVWIGFDWMGTGREQAGLGMDWVEVASARGLKMCDVIGEGASCGLPFSAQH